MTFIKIDSKIKTVSHNEIPLLSGLSQPSNTIYQRRNRMSGSPRQGFTLVEMLVAIALAALLAAFLFTGLSKARTMALSSKCVSNLSQLGAAITLCASENNGQWILTDLPHGLGPWTAVLMKNGYISSSGNGTFCPAWPPSSFTQYQTYGENWLGFAAAPDVTLATIHQIPPFPASPTFKSVALMSIKNPANFILMGDSIAAGNLLQYQVLQSAGDEIHLRHNARANILFADGHVAACDTTLLKAAGWSWAYDQNQKSITF